MFNRSNKRHHIAARTIICVSRLRGEECVRKFFASPPLRLFSLCSSIYGVARLFACINVCVRYVRVRFSVSASSFAAFACAAEFLLPALSAHMKRKHTHDAHATMTYIYIFPTTTGFFVSGILHYVLRWHGRHEEHGELCVSLCHVHFFTCSTLPARIA